MPEQRRSSDTVVGFKIPSWIANNATAWFVTAALGLMGFGALYWSDGRYWMRMEEKAQVYQGKLMSIDKEIKSERKQIRIWENYNEADPLGKNVGARLANIKDSNVAIKALVEDKQTEIQKWESEK